jgi:hypothetical protein
MRLPGLTAVLHEHVADLDYVGAGADEMAAHAAEFFGTQGLDPQQDPAVRKVTFQLSRLVGTPG